MNGLVSSYYLNTGLRLWPAMGFEGRRTPQSDTLVDIDVCWNGVYVSKKMAFFRLIFNDF